MECTIRDAERRDVPAIAALVQEFASYMRDLGDTSELKLDEHALMKDGFGHDPAFSGIVAEVGGVIVGFLLHHPGYDTDAAARLLFVVDLYVTQSARGHGYGAALMNAARVIAARSGARQLVWTVDRRNALGRRFYEALGATYVDDLHLMCIDV